MQNEISRILRKELNNENKKVFLCIGTSNCIGDSLGPRVGELLSSRLYSGNVYVIGNLRENVNHGNIYTVLKSIYTNINNPYLIIIDSALSNKRYIGDIVVSKKNMVIGSALDKKHYKLGNFSIKGIVGENKNNSKLNFNTLNEVSENIIKKLSDDITSQIFKAFEV